MRDLSWSDVHNLPWYAYVGIASLFIIPFAISFVSTTPPLPPVPPADTVPDEEPKTIMQPAAEKLPAPLDTPYTPEELSKYKTPETGIYLAIKGTVFDVTRKADVYGPGKSYSVFTGKDGSRGLGMSSLKPEDAIDNIEGMDPKDEKTLNEWYAFFEKRYAIVGKVVKPDAKLES